MRIFKKLFLVCSLTLFCSLVAANMSVFEAKVPVVKIGENVVKLEVADTPEKIERGLMFRTSLDKNSGMVFLFNPARKVKFWMYNCLMPLDMIFTKDGKIVKIEANVPPCKSKFPRQCPTYPEKPILADKVIEVNAGYCKKHGIKEGDTVKFSFN